MLKWVLVTVVILLIMQGLWPWLRRVGFGRLPLDFSFKWRNRIWHVPLGSVLLLSVLLWLLRRWL